MKNNKKGFTLVELVVSFALLSIIAMLVISMVGSMIVTQSKNRQRSEATSIKTGILDEIKSTQHVWNTLDGLRLWLSDEAGYAATGNDVYRTTVTDEKNVDYMVDIYIDSLPQTEHLFQVTVTVNSKYVTDSTLVTRYKEYYQ